MSKTRFFAGLAILLVVTALTALPALASPFVQSLALTCLMFAGLAVSWSMFSGPTGYLSLATSAFFGLGAYCTAWGLTHLPWPVVVAAGGGAAMLFAFLIGMVVLRLRGAYFAVITYGLGELVKHTITPFRENLLGHRGRVMTRRPRREVVYWSVLIITLLAVVAYVAVGRSRVGHALRASAWTRNAPPPSREPDARQADRLLLSAWFAGALGAAMAVRWTYIDPNTVFNPFIVFQTVLMSMVGGPAHAAAPCWGRWCSACCRNFCACRCLIFT